MYSAIHHHGVRLDSARAVGQFAQDVDMTVVPGGLFD